MLYDLIIIGGGPAGITAGIYASRKKIKTLLLTKDFWGQIAKTGEVDNWPGDSGISGLKLMEKMEKHLRSFEIDIKKGEEVINVWQKEAGQERLSFTVQTKSGQIFSGRTVIVAVGRKQRLLGVKGEKELVGKGVSYCPICDAPFFQGKRVAVVGGGNAGLEAALDLVKYARNIFIFERGNKLIGDEMLQEKVRRGKKIEIFLQKEVQEIIGPVKVQAIRFRDLNTKKSFQMPMDGVFIQIGMIPATDFLSGLVKTNKMGEVKVNANDCSTSVQGIFAAGDVTNCRWKQLIIAAGQGTVAALSVYDYLNN